ncbi:DUF6542 domain-containing protein [Blastococcus montanus]|uniref:DUF6542 domain-containing protein n=1 Tax=Blastococcus montanus TaxID=3144973 RepID=UPI00320B8618
MPGRAGDRLRVAERDPAYDRLDEPRPGGPRRPDRPSGARPAAAGTRGRTAAPPAARDSKLRGVVAVLGIFLLTLAGGAIDSFVGTGLGLITLVVLTASTSAAALLVRRRDLLTVIVSPPLVFLAVAAVNVALAPSAPFNLATMATLLVRGFPTMAAATVAAVVLALVRLATRR